MQRAAISIASNVAEGCERGGKDFARFLRIAQGSAAELRTQAYIAAKLGMLPANELNEIIQELKTIARMLTGLHRSIESKQKTATRPPKTEH
jgi:four helix bundle protein